MNNVYFIIAPSGSGKTSICNLLKEKYNITFDEYNNCATAEQVENNDLYVIDPNGVDYFIKSYKGKKTPKIIFIDSDLTTRYDRMVKRAEEKGDTFLNAVDKALSRIKTDVVEFYDYTHNKAHVDFTVDNNKNDNLIQVVDKIYDYICDCEREVR